MSYNGSGIFDINSFGQPVVPGTLIEASVFNLFAQDIATGLSTAITRDGQSQTTVRIPFAFGINSSLVDNALSANTGSIISQGGIGVAKDIYVGGKITALGGFDVTGATTFAGLVTFNAGAVIAAGQSLVGSATGTISGFLSVAATTGTFTNVGGTVTTATQNSVTTMTGLTTVGALNAGSITSGFGAINIGSNSLTAGAITGSSLTGTLSTAAQPNVTSLGTLTGLRTSGNVGFGAAADANFRLYVVGSDSTSSNYALVLRNSSIANLLLIDNTGAATFSGSLTAGAISGTTGAFTVSGNAATTALTIKNTDTGGWGAALLESYHNGTTQVDGAYTYVVANGSAPEAKKVFQVRTSSALATRMELSGTGLAVTGTLSATGHAGIGTTADANYSLYLLNQAGGASAHGLLVQASANASAKLLSLVADGVAEVMGVSGTGSLTLAGTGPHAIGGATNANRQLTLRGVFAGSTASIGLAALSELTGIVNGASYLVEVSGTLNKAGSGTHVDFVGLWVGPPTIGAGAATLTNATTLKIAGAPSVGTNQRALWVTAGLTQLDGGLAVTGTLSATALPAFVASDRYVVVDAAGNFHKSAIGPAS